MSASCPSSVVYSCTFADYDYTFGPLEKTPGAEFLRFGTTKPNRHGIWQHHPVPAAQEMPTQTLTNRKFKLFPGQTIPECDVAVYIDGNILVRADLSPLIQEFWDSNADIALFPHPSGRSLAEEIDFALDHKIPKEDVALAEAQREKYRALGLLDIPITENTILFYRMGSPKIAAIGDMWWQELEDYCKRDQISLPFVLHHVKPRVHLWDWHFQSPGDDNPYFARSGHRRANPLARMRGAAFFMKDYAFEYRALYGVLKAGGAVRNLPKQIARNMRGRDGTDV